MQNNKLHVQSRGQSSKEIPILYNAIMRGHAFQPHLLLIVFANEKIPEVQLGLNMLLQIQQNHNLILLAAKKAITLRHQWNKN